MHGGSFIPFLLPYKDDEGHYVPSEDQAASILEKAQSLIDEGAHGVAITYSANYGQTRSIRAAYARGGYRTNITGANQAAVMMAMEDLLDTPAFKVLQGKVRIAPITTMSYGGADPLTVVRDDLAHIKAILDEGWTILGWQNQDTVRTDRPFAVGGGVAGQLPETIAAAIQSTLASFAAIYSA